MREPIAGMDKRESKAESLFLKKEEKKEWYEEETEKESGRRQKIEIYYDEPFFGKIPQELLRDPTIKSAPKALFGLCHTYGKSKQLSQNPRRYVTQERLAKDLGVHRNTIHRWLKELEEKGWITMIPGGWTRANRIILHGRKKQKRGRNSNRG